MMILSNGLNKIMVNAELLRQILVDNRAWVEAQKVIPRDIVPESGDNVVLLGVRGAGKSAELFRKMQLLRSQGTSWNDMLYLNFADERLLGFEVGDFNRILEVHASRTGESRPPILFLDEIQNINGWEKFARRMADQKIACFITGSNAKMLSREIGTTLGGRYRSVMVYPLSFDEALDFSGVAHDENAQTSTQGRAVIANAFGKYFHFGGFPELQKIDPKIAYLNSVYQRIYLNDILARNRIEDLYAMRFLLRKIAQSVGQSVSFSRLTNLVSEAGAKIAKMTLIKYVEYARDAFLILSLENFHGKLAQKVSTPKYYFVDNGLLTINATDADSSLLENMVALQLLRTYGLQEQVFYYKDSVEVDFYVPEAETAIQVCMTLKGNPQTLKRELGALVKLSQSYPCKRLLVVTRDEEGIQEYQGKRIEVLPAWKWLLEKHY